MRDIVMLFALIAALPMVFRRPFAGVVLWAWTSFIFPDDYFYGFMNEVPMTKIVSGLTILCVLFSREKKNFFADKLTIVIALFAVLGIVSSLFSTTVYINSWDIGSRTLKVLSFCLIMLITTRNQLRVHAVLMAVCLALAFHGSLEGIRFILTGTPRGAHFASFGDNNNFALAICLTIPILMYLGRYSSQRAVRIGFMVAAGLCAVAVVGTFSRGGFLGLVTVALATVLSGKNKIRNGFYVAMVGVALLSMAPSSWFERVDTIASADQDTSFMGRVVAWKMSVLIALDHPFIGAGFLAVQDKGVWEYYSAHFDTLSFIPTDEPSEAPHAAHSIYFEVLGDLGFTGLILFLALLALAQFNILAIRKRARMSEQAEWAGSLAGSLRISMFAYMVTGAALSMAYFELVFVILTTLVVLRRLVEHDLVPQPLLRPASPFALQRPGPSGAPAQTGAI